MTGDALNTPSVQPGDVCPRCESEEWDEINWERGRERDVPFNRCYHCEHEWPLTPHAARLPTNPA
jgi:Zn ribbon nucleic-acid-binding protein